MVSGKLFIEGSLDTKNGNLRQGFGMLIEKIVKGRKLIRITMGGGKKQTIDKFNNSLNSKLLCDLDAPDLEIEADLKIYGILKEKESVYYMIQEMEAWFISQPDILDKFYNHPVSKKLSIKPAKDFTEPDKELQRITKDTKRGTYHKVSHGCQLLQLLDPKKLYRDFPDFQRLIDDLR